MSQYYSANPIADFNRWDRDQQSGRYGRDIIKRTIKAYEGEKQE